MNIELVLLYSVWFGAIISLICAIYVALIVRNKRKQYFQEINNKEEIKNGDI